LKARSRERRADGGCGAIRHECAAAPAHGRALHLSVLPEGERDRARLAPHVPKAATTITGAARFYERTADGGNTLRRGFCPRCGAAVYGWPEVLVPRPATWTTRSGFGPR